MLELNESDFSVSDLTSILGDKELLATTLSYRGLSDLRKVFDEYALKIRAELLRDGHIVEAPTNWATPIPEIYKGIKLTATGKAIAAELEKAKDGINSKIGKNNSF